MKLNTHLEKISRVQFDEMLEQQVFSNDCSTEFAILKYHAVIYCFGWRSSEIEPDVRLVDEEHCLLELISILQFFVLNHGELQ